MYRYVLCYCITVKKILLITEFQSKYTVYWFHKAKTLAVSEETSDNLIQFNSILPFAVVHFHTSTYSSC